MIPIEFKPTPELIPLMETLGQSSAFKRLMEIIEARCTGLAVAAHSFPDATYRMWAAGRVHEMSDLLSMYHSRHELVREQMPSQRTEGNGF